MDSVPFSKVGRAAEYFLHQRSLHDVSGALIGQNDNWGTTIPGGVITSDQVAEIQASGLAPGDSHESAIISTLEPGNYTAIIRGVNNTTGVALVEVYDLDTTASVNLVNISTRGFVETGDNVMIGGLIILGSTPEKVIIRAIGPELTAYGVPGALQDPTLELHDGQGNLIAFDDNWKDSQQTEIAATGLFPTDDREGVPPELACSCHKACTTLGLNRNEDSEQLFVPSWKTLNLSSQSAGPF
jgi:hypothetical protein